jgi:predicted dehydrogenase
VKQVNWGIIGLGTIATKFADAFKLSKKAKLLAIASKNQNKIKYFKEKFNIEDEYCFNNYEDLLKSKKIDIIYIALPNSLHFEWILKCIENKKRILVEKPAVLNFKEIDILKKKIGDIFFAEAFMYAYHPQTIKVIDLLANDKIGKLISMESSFGINIMTKKNFLGFTKKKIINEKSRVFNKDLGGGAILDLGCYPVSLSTLIGLFNSDYIYKKIEVKNIQKKLGSTGVDIDAAADLYFQNGFKSSIRASFTENLGQKSFIKGTKGNIIIQDTWTADKALVEIESETIIKKIQIESEKNIYFYEIEAISKCVIDNKNKPEFPGINFDNTLINTKILDEWLN